MMRPDTEIVRPKPRNNTESGEVSDPEQTKRIFVVRLQATNADGVHALRAFLKAAWRRHGLKALSVTEEKSEALR
jgi:hypothetical protein